MAAKTEPKPSTQLHMLLQEDQAAAIDEWRWAWRVEPRSEAIRALLGLGLKADAGDVAAHLGRPAHKRKTKGA